MSKLITHLLISCYHYCCIPDGMDMADCDSDNGGCEHTCTVVDGSVECSCRDGYVLVNDGKNCDG